MTRRKKTKVFNLSSTIERHAYEELINDPNVQILDEQIIPTTTVEQDGPMRSSETSLQRIVDYVVYSEDHSVDYYPCC